MVEIYYTKHSETHSPEFLNECLKIFPVKIKEKLLRQKNKKSMYNSLLGNLLLIEAFKNKYPRNVLEDVDRSEHGRPFIPDFNDYDFNISHSGNYVVCAIGEKNLGVDIEKLKTIDLEPLKAFFTTKEWHSLRNSVNKNTSFYKLWTQKEAILKADGRGLKIPLKEIIIKNDSQGALEHVNWFLNEVKIDQDYVTHLATEIPLQEYKIVSVVFKPLIETKS